VRLECTQRAGGLAHTISKGSTNTGNATSNIYITTRKNHNKLSSSILQEQTNYPAPIAYARFNILTSHVFLMFVYGIPLLPSVDTGACANSIVTHLFGEISPVCGAVFLL
jgi:hypothetical protein